MSPLEVLEQITRANSNRACDAIGFIREGGVISRQQFLPLFGEYMPWNYISSTRSVCTTSFLCGGATLGVTALEGAQPVLVKIAGSKYMLRAFSSILFESRKRAWDTEPRYEGHQ